MLEYINHKNKLLQTVK